MKPSPLASKLSRKLSKRFAELMEEYQQASGRVGLITGWTAKRQAELMSGAATWNINDIHSATRLFGMSPSDFLKEADL